MASRFILRTSDSIREDTSLGNVHAHLCAARQLWRAQAGMMRLNRGVLALLLTVAIWGSTFVATKVALHDMGPLALSVLRFAVAFAILAPLARRPGYRLRMSFTPTFLSFGLTGVALFYGLQNLALKYTSAVNAVLVLAILPALTALLAVWQLKERLTALQVAGIVMALAGMAIVGRASGGSEEAPNPLLGNLLIVGCVISWAVYTIQGKRLSAQYSPLVTTSASIGAGLLMLLPLGIGEVWLSGPPHMSGEGLLAILYLGLVASALPMFLWNYALNYVPASVASLYLNLVPVVGVILALITGESIGLWQVVGGLFTLVGVWVSGRSAGRQGPARPGARLRGDRGPA
jgi:drug/metabolite transporter (DMT)-like permease